MNTQAGDTPLNHPTLLCVDDERNVLFTLRTQLLRHFPDYRVEIVESAEEALELLDALFSHGIDVPLVIADQIMPGMQGDELLIELHARYPQMLKVMLTGQASAENVGNVVNRGNLYRFIAKPWDETDLTLTVTEALRRYQQDRQLAQKQAELEQANRELAVLNASLEQQVQERTQQLQSSEANLKKAQELVHLGHWEYGLATRQVYWSEELYRIHGFDPTQPICIGEEAIQYIHPDDHRKYRQEILAKIARGEGFITDLRISDRDGAVRFIETRGEALFDADHAIIGYRGTVQDITERKQLELALQESQAKLSAVLDSSLAGVLKFRFYPDGTLSYDYISPHCETILGYPPDELASNLEILRSYIHPDDWQTAFHPVIEQVLVLRDNANYAIEYRFRRQDGTFCWILEKCWVSWCEAGRYWDLTTVMLDISDRKQAELALQQLNAQLEQRVAQRTQELAHSEQDLRTIFNNVYDAILIHDMDGTVLDVNERAMELHHATREQLLNASIADLSAPDVPLDVMPINIQRMQAGETLRLEWKHRRFDDQSVFDVELSLRPVVLGDHSVFIAGIRDISDRKQYEAQLQRTNEELLHATRLKDEFLATMSHELRTPLNAILGTTESLQEAVFGAITPAQQQALAMIDQSGYHLLSLINDILDVAKIEAGEITLECQATAIAPLCESSLALIQPQARKKEIQLDLQLSPPLPVVWIDERRIRQVLLNLLSNAVKFTPAGGQITLAVSYSPPAPEDQKTNGGIDRALYLSVQDTGIGIAPDQQHRIFQPFVQLDSALNRRYEGTGLGLTLVKRIVELHGGKVQLSSEVGVGSCFTVVLPAWIKPTNTSSEAATVSRLDTDLSPMSLEADPLVLLAEDNEANRQTIALYLSAKGYRVLLAEDGQEAIALALLAHPAVIVMDIQMPGVNGLEAIERIRSEPDGRTVPIIALTALAMPNDRDRCLAAEANEYLSKPVKLKQLDSTIRYLLSSKPNDSHSP